MCNVAQSLQEEREDLVSGKVCKVVVLCRGETLQLLQS